MTLKPCPNCGGPPEKSAKFVACKNGDCLLCGPNGDPTGSKWNALPRRGDVSSDEKQAFLDRVAIAVLPAIIALESDAEMYGECHDAWAYAREMWAQRGKGVEG